MLIVSNTKPIRRTLLTPAFSAVISLVLGVVCSTNALAQTATGAITAVAPPNTAVAPPNNVPGGVYVWPVPPDARDITFAGKPAMIYGGYAIIGIPISHSPGSAVIHYRQHNQDREQNFSIIGKTYTEQHITLQNQDLVTPPEATLARIQEESSRQRRLYANRAPLANLNNGFIKPLEGITTSLYGHRRFFNGKPRNPHSGLDIAADTGTPIIAVADARVSLADELYFNGNTLFLDHGEGLVTMYCHMSELLVTEGDTVKQGQPIGLVGATGRATGPHLHWSVSLNGVRVDPELFMQAFNPLSQSSGE